MSEKIKTAVLSYYEYHGPSDQSTGNTRHFCGECRRGLGGVYGSSYFGWPEYPEDVLEKCEASWGLAPMKDRSGESLEYYAFCPWCGAEFPEEWWKRENLVIQNERLIDHFKNPGHHKGDQHVFEGGTPNGHYLGGTGPDICWCDPVVTPGPMGCEIRHNMDRTHEEYVSAQKASEDQEIAARRAKCVPMSLPDDHDEADCGYCESNRYDTQTCDTCEGAGCDDCEGHGYYGYSW